jgi:hypothetical protein
VAVERTGRPRAGAAWVTVGLGLVIVYLSVYPMRGYDQPRGYDTARYLWRTSCVAAGGLGELEECAPRRQEALPSRVGYPVVSLMLTGVLPASGSTVGALIPILGVAAIAMAGGALVSSRLGLPPPGLAIVSIVVGLSPMAVAMAAPEGYADMILALAVGLAAILAAVSAARVPYPVAAVLLAVAAVVHWPTGGVLAGSLLGTAVLTAHARTDGSQAVRLAAVVGLAAVVWALVLLVVVQAIPDTFRIAREVFEEKLASHVPRLGLPVGLPAAVLGLVALARLDRWDPRGRRGLLVLLAVWLGIIVAALSAWLLGWNLPIHRFLLLSIPIPLLGAIALLWLADLGGRRSASRRRAVLVAGCVAVTVVGFVLWFRSPAPVMRSARLDAAAAAAAYLRERVPPATQVTVLADDPAVPFDVLKQTFRVALPPERIASVQFRRRPLGPRLPKTEVTLNVDGYSKDFEGPGPVVVLAGPAAGPARPAVSYPRIASGLELIALGAGALAIVALVGVGWADLAFGHGLRDVEVLAVSPAFGIAALVGAGLLADLSGLGLGPVVAIPVLLGTAAVGGALALAWRHRSERGNYE